MFVSRGGAGGGYLDEGKWGMRGMRLQARPWQHTSLSVPTRQSHPQLASYTDCLGHTCLTQDISDTIVNVCGQGHFIQEVSKEGAVRTKQGR